MMEPILLASGSRIRATLLMNAGVAFDVAPARVDEDAIKKALIQEAASPRDIADALAEMKAQKVSAKNPSALVIGCDQVLDLRGQLFDKPASQEDAISHLMQFSGQTHRLHSACVVYQAGQPVWRHVGVARMFVHQLSEGYVKDYVAQNWEDIRHCVGCYQLEGRSATFQPH